jgi:tRNA threonylcarbamoyladenosine biosynthesis protein TsaB
MTGSDMSKLLLIETATDVCSAALCIEGEVVAEETLPACPQHTAVLPLQVRACLERVQWRITDIEAVAVSGGPGSYTTLRTGISFAKGLCYALQKPLISISTLDALARAARHVMERKEKMFYMPMIDARRDEVWTALYDAEGQMVCPTAPLILDKEAFSAYTGDILSKGTIVCCGNGASKIPPALLEIYDIYPLPSLICSAAHLAPIAHQKFVENASENLLSYVPLYMKAPNITNSVKFS